MRPNVDHSYPPTPLPARPSHPSLWFDDENASSYGGNREWVSVVQSRKNARQRRTAFSTSQSIVCALPAMSANSRARSTERMRVAMVGGRLISRGDENEERKRVYARPKTTPRFRADIKFSFCRPMTRWRCIIR